MSKRKRGAETEGRSKEKTEKVSHRIFLIFAILLRHCRRQRTRAHTHNMHDTYYPIEWVLEDKLLFPMLLRESVCKRAQWVWVWVCDVSLLFEISVYRDWISFLPAISETLMSLSLLLHQFTLSFSVFKTNTKHIHSHSHSLSPIYLSVTHYFFFLFFFVFCCMWSVLR